MKVRTYSVLKRANGRLVLAVHSSLPEIPFHVWRDVSRLAGTSYDLTGKVMFEFLIPNNLDAAEKVLRGGMYQKV